MPLRSRGGGRKGKVRIASRGRNRIIRYPGGDFATPRRPVEEVKQFNYSVGSTPVYDGAAGQFLVDLTAVTQGVSGAQRAGDHLFIRHLQLRLLFFNNYGVNSNLETSFRAFVFQYLGDSSVAAKPIISDFLNISAANGGNTYGSFSSFDIDYDRQYRMLYDSKLVSTYGTFGLAATGVPSSGLFRHLYKAVSLVRCDRNISFYTGGTTGPNHVFLLITTDEATIAANPSVYVSAELRFTDS